MAIISYEPILTPGDHLLAAHKKPGMAEEGVPDDPVGSAADGHDGRLVLVRDLEQVAEDVVLEEPAAVRHRRPELGDRGSVHASSAHPLLPLGALASLFPSGKTGPAAALLTGTSTTKRIGQIDFIFSPLATGLSKEEALARDL